MPSCDCCGKNVSHVHSFAGTYAAPEGAACDECSHREPCCRVCHVNDVGKRGDSRCQDCVDMAAEDDDARWAGKRGPRGVTYDGEGSNPKDRS